MSRSNKHIAKYNNFKTSSGRFEPKRSAGVFKSDVVESAVDSVLLYQLVFKSKKAFLMAILLCLCFATQSIKFAQASEEENTSPEVQVEIEEVVPETTPEPGPEINTGVEDSENEEAQENVAESEPGTSINESESLSESVPTEVEKTASKDNTDNSEATTVSTSTPILTSTTSVDMSESESGTTTEVDLNTATTSTEIATTSEVQAEIEAEDLTSATNTDVQSESDSTDDSASSQQSVSEDEETVGESNDYVQEAPVTSNENLVFTTESDTHFSFDKNECTRIEDGTFYCQEQEANVVLSDSLIAAPDSDGDLEIYLVKNGERYQITHNEVDDASPYYDELSDTIVWHRLLSDRYQIISYDINSGEEEQFTQTKVNNMEPSRHGKYTVWQRWVGNNWEVILHDGQTETQITNSARHDIAPHIRGPLVIWNSQSNDGSQELRTYDIQSKTHTTIADSEGVSVSNPRMVVMYEAMYENGDIVTKGFDLVSGKIVPLQALPKQLPNELPDSEPTEEVRALIQNKPEPKEAVISNIEPPDGNRVLPTATSTEQIATSSPDTLDLRTLSTPELVEHLTQNTSASSTIPDVVIENEQSEITGQSEQQKAIADLVVPPIVDVQSTGTSTQTAQE